MEGNVEVYIPNQDEEFSFENIILRRADPDDSEQIARLVEPGKDECFNRVYGYPKILKLIETAYLSISVLDRNGNVIAFAAFDDVPQGMKGQYDKKHYGLWEEWMKTAFSIDEFNSFNTVWMTYFIAAGPITHDDQKLALNKILQSVYTSLPDLIGVLYLLRGEADQEDSYICFEPIKECFQEIEGGNEEVLKQVRGVHHNSTIHFSSRLQVLPFVEVRRAQQEDHDDLAEVFNSQSEAVTETYGEFFIAELIAAQSDTNKALVAQVKNKAIGLTALTSDVDIKLLQKCFDLDCFDNLLKADFMDAVRSKREEIMETRKREAEEQRIKELKKLKEETMICNRIAQRIAIQEYLMRIEKDMLTTVENYLSNDDEAKKLDRRAVEHMFKGWLKGFKLKQPSDYFLDHPTDDYELVCNIQSELEFLISTLEIFGLPKGYMTGAGHFADWGKKDAEDKLKNAKKRTIANKIKAKKDNNLAKLKRDKMREAKQEEENKVPTHFDLAPFLKAFKSFSTANAEARSAVRIEIGQDSELIHSIFVDEDKEFSYKKCVDIITLGKTLNAKGLQIPSQVVDVIGQMLICFGEIAYEVKTETRMPEQPVEEVKEEKSTQKDASKGVDKAKMTQKEILQKQAEQQLKEQQQQEPQQPITVTLYNTSIHDLLQAIDKMADYDFTLNELDIIDANLEAEKSKKAAADQLALEQSKKSNTKSIEDAKTQVKAVSTTKYRYSDDPQYDSAVGDLEDLETIPEAPLRAQNAFAITLFCIESAFESRSKDFLKYAFDLFPDRDYLIVTQPHTVSENPLLQNFTLATKKAENTFSHVLYVCHRDSLMASDIRVRKIDISDIEKVNEYIDSSGDDTTSELKEAMYECVVNPESKRMGFMAEIGGEAIGVFVMAKDVNMRYYTAHFHIQSCILLDEHEKKAHTRIIHSLINPIFEKSTRFILKEILRLSGKTCLYFETHNRTTIPTIFNELIHIRSRRFPHFLKRKWDHERNINDEVDEDSKLQEGGERDHLDEDESIFALSFVSKKLLSEPKITKNTRIVIVGASDTGISFAEALLSINYTHFTNIVLLAPGGLPHQYSHISENLKAYSTSYTMEEQKRLMLESRIRVVNARMIEIDRSEKNILLHDDTIIPYDTLILTMGLQDKTLPKLGYVSRGITPIPNALKRMEGLISIDDPYLYQHLREGGTLMTQLAHKKKPQKCVLYGRSISTFFCAQGLIKRGMRPSNITIVIPDMYAHVNDNYDSEQELIDDMPIVNPSAFEDEKIELKLHNLCERLGINILKNLVLKGVVADEDGNLASAIFHKIGVEELKVSIDSSGNNIENSNEVHLECKVLITAGHRDVDDDVFNSIHNNGLVYNGRLFVDKNFQTRDPFIFAGGSLCEFSGRYKALAKGKSLRLDRYNGREIGSRLSRAVFDIFDPTIGSGEQSILEEELPNFYLPQGHGGMLPYELYYYHIKSTNSLPTKSSIHGEKNRPDLLSDNLNEEGKGHLIKFSFNNIGVVESVTYMGSEEVVLQSLWSFVGLHETYLNSLSARFEKGIIPNVAEFLSENWALTLYHEWFGDFTLRLRQDLQESEDVQKILEKALSMTQHGEGISREKMDELIKSLSKSTESSIMNEAVEFIRANYNHLPMYHIAGKEFA